MENAISQLCDDPALYARMSVPVFPYGDGQAAKRIVAAMQRDWCVRFRIVGGLDHVPMGGIDRLVR